MDWIELRYRGHRQLYRYLYSSWRIASELKIKPVGRRIIAYLTFTKEGYNPLMIRIAVKRAKRHLTLDRSPVALGSRGL